MLSILSCCFFKYLYRQQHEQMTFSPKSHIFCGLKKYPLFDKLAFTVALSRTLSNFQKSFLSLYKSNILIEHSCVIECYYGRFRDSLPCLVPSRTSYNTYASRKVDFPIIFCFKYYDVTACGTVVVKAFS